MGWIIVFFLLALVTMFVLGYATGKYDKEEYKENEEDDFVRYVRRANKRIDFNLSSEDDTEPIKWDIELPSFIGSVLSETTDS